MTVDEFSFLALGLLLGLAAGAALIEVLRARPPAPREVRVTVAQDVVPRRSSTLAEDAFATAAVGAAPETGDPHGTDRTVERRTPVRPAIAGGGGRIVTVTGSDGLRIGARRIHVPDAGERVGGNDGPASPNDGHGPRWPAMVGVPVSRGADPVLAALHAVDARAATTTVKAPARGMAAPKATDARTPMPAPAPTASVNLAATATAPRSPTEVAHRVSARTETPEGGLTGPGATAPAAGADQGPCAESRRLADERCELSGRARAGAGAAEDSLRAAQRAYDEHEARADAAARRADAREVRAAKDAAQAAFRGARERAGRTEDVEAAARAWLSEINRINTEAREGALAVTREREAARTTALQLERLAVEADAARISAETAEAACLAAREALADCEERSADDPSANQPSFPSRGPAGLFVDEPSPLGALATDGTPRVFRLLRGDRSAMSELVTGLAGDDPDERRRWQLTISDLVDAILADTIAASVLEFPEDHPFWGSFSQTQDREIAAALSSLGYRFDGLRGWVDGRIPSQRDLSLALGYAGLDPMRIRHWPQETEMAALFEDVKVAADERLAAVAGDLTLGELVGMLGRRADGLAEAWNAWGRLRPLLLEER